MKARILLVYQLLTGFSDTSTGLLLLFAPALTLRLMRLQVAPAALPFLSYVGAFVLSVGLACLYGAYVIGRAAAAPRLETVWLLTGVTRALVALFVITQIVGGGLQPGWVSVAITDGIFAIVQGIGLAKGWLSDV